MKKVLSKKFFQHNSHSVARKLLGKVLVRKIGKKKMEGMITDVEVYDGFSDLASHASRGKTKRNEVMFGEGGVWYVYFTYGMHWMLNIVTREHGYPAAILIRGVLVDGVSYKKTNGPAKLTKYFHIDKTLNKKIAVKKSGLWIEAWGEKPKKILKARRIGIDYAGKWRDRLWRYILKY